MFPLFCCVDGFPAGRGEESALRVMLERREAELREAMKLRHSLATLLHALRADMEQVAITGVSTGEWGFKEL